MAGTSRWIRLVGGVVVMAALLVGCTKASGGGWIVSATGEGKATFGFRVDKCEETVVDNSWIVTELSGQFQYNDGPAGVRFHSHVWGMHSSTIGIGATCERLAELYRGFPLLPGETAFVGYYQPYPTGEGGDFHVGAVDGGEPGQDDDFICITLDRGEYDGYQNCQPLSGGNIQVDSSD